MAWEEMMGRVARAGWALLFLTMLTGVARADATADFYAKRVVTIVAGTATGGTYDLYARTIARHIGKYIPGSPKVVVPNTPKFDALNINWLGAVAGYNVLMLVRSDVPVYSVDDLRKRETVMATIAAGQFNSVVV